MKKKSYSIYVALLIVVSLLFLAASIMACGRQSNVADITEITPETSIRTNASETVANSNYPETTVETNIPEIVTETTIPDYLLEHIKDINSNLQTYECETEMTLYIKNESQKEDMTFVRKSSVALDKINGNMSVSIEESESGEFNNSRVDEPFTGAKGVLYFIGKDTYFGGYDENGKSVSWDKNLYDEEERGQIAVTNWQAELQMGILEKSTVKLIQLKDLQGTLCYLVEISPDLNSLLDYARWEGMDVEANYQQRLQGVKKATADYWFDQDSLLFERAYIYFEVEIEGEMPLYYTFEAHIIFDKVNEKLDIQLPPEANELTTENIQDRILDD